MSSVGTDSQDRPAEQLMTKDPHVIYEYTDWAAVQDGVLVPFAGPQKVNRITRAVFDHFTENMGQSPSTGPVIDTTTLVAVINTLLKRKLDESGWRTGTFQDKELWLVPNEVNGLTLMFPSDY